MRKKEKRKEKRERERERKKKKSEKKRERKNIRKIEARIFFFRFSFLICEVDCYSSPPGSQARASLSPGG